MTFQSTTVVVDTWMFVFQARCAAFFFVSFDGLLFDNFWLLQHVTRATTSAAGELQGRNHTPNGYHSPPSRRQCDDSVTDTERSTSSVSNGDEDQRDNDNHPFIELQCPICLDEFHDGDEICVSQNQQCRHVFHHVCIKEWLLRHEECPCCRNNFLMNTTSANIQQQKQQRRRRRRQESLRLRNGHPTTEWNPSNEEEERHGSTEQGDSFSSGASVGTIDSGTTTTSTVEDSDRSIPMGHVP